MKRAASLAVAGEEVGRLTHHLCNRSWLNGTSASVKVQKEPMRNASVQTAMNADGRAMLETKHFAKSQVVGLMFGSNSQHLSADAVAATTR
jgi:hypothetical protein